MKKLLLATSCLALSSTISMAADMSVPYSKAPVMAAPVFTWTGCYVGAHVGGGTMTSNYEGASNGGSANAFDSSNGRGAVAGGQGGCNYQDGNWVFGLEGEGYWSGIKTTNNGSFINTSTGVTRETFGSTVANNNDFTIAARAGFTMDRTWIYGKAGWAWGSIKGSQFDTCCSPGTPTTSSSVSSGTLDGFLIGVGIEHALTRNWTVKLEYDYIGFGTKELAFTSCNTGSPCTVPGTFSFSATKQIFKVGANYLFDIGGAPLVAKY
jgi:outer membrane immunogenic protein